jgi:hypothetical protein
MIEDRLISPFVSQDEEDDFETTDEDSDLDEDTGEEDM